jgi:tyrosine-specific transport protein
MKPIFSHKVVGTACALAGNIIGAGILGLPYVFSKSGFFVGLFWIIALGMIVLYTFLCLGEVALRTNAKLQLLGYTEKYLGKNAKKIMFFALIFGVYAALLAYLIGEGQSISFLFTGTTHYSLYAALAFWLLMTILYHEGLRGLKKISIYGITAIIAIIFFIAVFYFPHIETEHLTEIHWENIFLPFGVVLFSLIGFNSIPELEMIIKGSEKKFKKAIILGVTIPILLYVLFSFVVVGSFGINIPEVATIGLGKLFSLLGMFTMFTCYFVLSFSLKDVYLLDFTYSRKKTFFLVNLVPLALYLILYYFNRLNFIQVLGIGGVISGGVTAILILLMNRRSKKSGDRKPEYNMKINWPIIIFLSVIFIAGIVFEIVF